MSSELDAIKRNAADAVAERLDASVATIRGNLFSTHLRVCRLMEEALLHSEDLTEGLRALCSALPRADASDRDALPDEPTDSPETLHTLFTEQRAESDALPITPLPDAHPSLAMLYRMLETAERLAFCRTLSADHSVPNTTLPLIRELFGGVEPVGLEASGKVAYQRNIFADEAYLHFSPHIQSPKAAYFGSFSGVCEQVYDGLCEYCILPLESSQDGKLLRFYGLIQKYELKIVLTCDVTASDKQQITKFGLCRRSLPISPAMFYDTPQAACLEFIFWQDSDGYPELCNVLSAAEACSLRVIRVDCLPRSDDEILVGAGYPFNISLDIENGDLHSFLLFLALDAPFCLPLGIYRQL